MKMQKTQFENAKTQFTGDLLAWTGRAMRSKTKPWEVSFWGFSRVKWETLYFSEQRGTVEKATTTSRPGTQPFKRVRVLFQSPPSMSGTRGHRLKRLFHRKQNCRQGKTSPIWTMHQISRNSTWRWPRNGSKSFPQPMSMQKRPWKRASLEKNCYKISGIYPKILSIKVIEEMFKKHKLLQCQEKILHRSTVEVHDERSEGVITGQLFPFWISKTLLKLHMTHIL